MQGTQVIYLGRSIAKEGFRAFIYGSQGNKKLVKNWDEFEAHMASGIWFATQNEAKQQIEEQEELPQDEFKSKLEAHRKRGK
jgi:hypothetical protein